MAENSKIESHRVSYLCTDCGEIIYRKHTEPPPKSCPACGGSKIMAEADLHG